MSSDLSAASVITSLAREDVLEAIEEIERNGVPGRRRSAKFCLQHRGHHYPPKLVISYASAFRYADEPELHQGLAPEAFAGGEQSNEALDKMKFNVVKCQCGGLKTRRAVSSKLDGPRIARLVVDGNAALTPDKGIECIRDISEHMRRHRETADIVVTPGGFIMLDLSDVEQPLGWETPESALRSISSIAERSLKPFIAKLKLLGVPAQFMTLGIDCWLDQSLEKGANAQLVATIDLKLTKIVNWTGKSYPTLEEERNLLHVTRLESHLQKLGRWKCLVLGCHDLNMFSPRGIANRNPRGNRGRRADALTRCAKVFHPDVILQHPHTTDTPNIWMGGWAGVGRIFSPKSYVSGISYHWPGHGRKHRAPLDEVLSRTRLGNVVDYIWSGAHPVCRSKRTSSSDV